MPDRTEDALRDDLGEVRKKIIGFGEESFKKSYYPMLQYKQDELRRFRVALDNTRDLVFILDYPSLHIKDINLRVEEVLGYSRQELLNMNFCRLTDEKIPEYLKKNISSSGSHGFLLKTGIFSKDGKNIHMEISVSSSSMGKEIYAAAVCRDITEREVLEKAIRESELQYRTTINTLKDIVIVIDSSLDIVIFNSAFEKVCRKSGKSAYDLKNLSALIRNLYYEEDLRLDDPSFYLRFFETNVKYKYDGGIVIYSVRNMPIFEKGVFKQSVLYLRDITEYYVMDEIKKEAFLQIDKNMEQFAVLNDHIRNPLQVILGIVDLECPGAVEKIMPYITEIDRIINRLDNGWIESEKVRKMIAKHYGVSLADDSEMTDTLNSLNKKYFLKNG